jgi:hypothetical protein
MWVIARACPYVPRSKQADTVFKSSASQTGALDFLQCFFRLLAPDNLRLAQLRAWQWVAGLICYATAGEPKVEKRNPRKNYRYVKRPRKFELSGSSLWHTYLQENGYVILKGALSVRESRVALDLVFDYLEALDTGIDRHDSSTKGQENWPDHLGAGILPWYGVGQSKAMWCVRSKAAVRKHFRLPSGEGKSCWPPSTGRASPALGAAAQAVLSTPKAAPPPPPPLACRLLRLRPTAPSVDLMASNQVI